VPILALPTTGTPVPRLGGRDTVPLVEIRGPQAVVRVEKLAGQ
jgi:hypothetical protein